MDIEFVVSGKEVNSGGLIQLYLVDAGFGPLAASIRASSVTFGENRLVCTG
jgi:hypothetical protein